MALCRLIYASRASEQLKAGELEQILEASRRNNQKHHVSGVLLFSAREFLQFLEGSREAVNQTYARILGDPRHAEVVILDYSEVARRQFSGWAMHQVAASWLSREVILTYSDRELFSPTRMSAASAIALLDDLAAQRARLEGDVPSPGEPSPERPAASLLARLRSR